MYKDKDKANQATKERMRRYRAKGVTTKGVTTQLKANTVTPNMRRGKDIQCFADLPLDIQAAIDSMSDTPEEHANRTAIAIDYQHKFPDSYHGIGVMLSGYKYRDVRYV